MAIAKRPTKELQAHGWTNLVVKKGLYGFYAIDTRYTKQTGTPVRKTSGEVLTDIISGKLPVNLDTEAQP